MKKILLTLATGCVALGLLMVSCESPLEINQTVDDSTLDFRYEDTHSENSFKKLKAHSVTPALIKRLPGFENVNVYPLISSDDTLEASPGYRFGGSADGAGFMRTQNGYTIVVNHEDNFAVSRIQLNAALKPKKADYILNSDGGKWRLCSGTLVTPEVHGFGPWFLTAGESGEESRTHALSPFSVPNEASVSRELPGLGRWNAENAVPLPKTAFPGKTVILIGDDDSDTHGGQVALYVSKTGDLDNGKLYVLRRKDMVTREREIVEGTSVAVEFVEIPNHKELTGAQMNMTSSTLHALAFGRVEDLDYRKDKLSGGREIYFNVTGQNNTGVNADYSRAKYGRVYKLVLNQWDMLSGKLEVVLDGDKRTASDKARDFQNPDNILVTENFAYIQEDPNAGYNDQTHDAYIYQYDLRSKLLKQAFELDHRRTAPDADKYNALPGSGYPTPVAGKSGYGSWEYGSFTDISETTGIPNTFMLCVQPHSWRSELFKGVDGGALRANENQGSQILIIHGLDR
jgi:hypothetical protein